MKKILIISLFILLVFILLLCVGTRNKSIDTKQPSISFSSWGSPSETEILKELISDFESKNPDIKINFIHIPQNYFQKLQLLFASGSEPDVIFINNQYLKLYTDANLLENLTESFPESKNEYYKEAIDCLSDNGKLYAVPRDISSLVIYYNKEIFKEKGITSPEISSVNDLIELCEKLKSDKYFAINTEDNPVFFLPFLAVNGGGIISDDGKEIIINSKKSLSAIDLYSDFINKYGYSPTKAEQGSIKPVQMFINGKLAMYISGRWSLPVIKNNANFKFEILNYPATQENKMYSDASGWAISKNSKHKEEAVNFVKYLSSEASSKKFTETGLIVPARRKIAESDTFMNTGNNELTSSVFIDSIKNSKPTPVNKNYSKITDMVKDKITTVLETGKPASEIIDNKTVKKAERLL